MRFRLGSKSTRVRLIALIVSITLCLAEYVDFKTSCSLTVHAQFNTALAQLYSFEYEYARSLFDQITLTDSTCCIAYYMAACTFTHPIWNFISNDGLNQTEHYWMKASQCVISNPQVTPREKAYIGALASYANTTDPAVRDPAARLQAYATHMERDVYTPYASLDEHAGILFGLSLLAVGYYSDSEPANGFPHLKAAAKIELEIIQQNPEAPGALHYRVHALDQPGMAPQALDAAYALADNACDVPHALHMPSHIYTDLGMWNQSVMQNIRSMNTAYNLTGSVGGISGMDWFHGAYFLQFAFLQLAMDCDALNQLSHYQELALTLPKTVFSHLASAVRVPLNYLIETRSWPQAAVFQLESFYNTSSASTWDIGSARAFRISEHFLNTVGRAVLNYSIVEIVASWNALHAANATLYSDNAWAKFQMPYWKRSFDMMVITGSAWKTFRQTSATAGISAMTSACVLQRKFWHPEVGHFWDAHEQLGEMYLLRNNTGDIQLALEAYKTAISVYPNRYHSLAGAGHCASVLQRKADACRYFTQLRTLTDPDWLPSVRFEGDKKSTCTKYLPDRRPELKAADAYLKQNCH